MKPLVCTFFVFFTLTAARAADFVVSMEDQVLEVPGFPYTVTRVFDGREQQYCIGMVQRGMGNRRTPAVLEAPLPEAFARLFQRSFPASADKKALAIRINRLQIYEITHSSTEVAIVECSITVLQEEGDHYVAIAECGVTREKYGLDVTKKHDENIAAALEECLLDFRHQELEGLLRHQELTAAQLDMPAPEIPAHPILSEAPKFGVYLTFSDFCNNRVASGNAYDLQIDTKTGRKNRIVKAIPRWTNGTPKEDVFALSNGDDLFLNVGDAFIQVERSGDTLFVWGPKNSGASEAVVIGTMFGGLVGGLIAAAVESATNDGLEAFRLDLGTGALIPKEEPVYRRIESRVTCINSEFNTAESVLEVSIDGRKIGTLKPATACKLHLPPPEKPVQICISKGAVQLCETIQPELFKTTLLLFRTKKDKLYIDQPDGDMRRGLLGKVKMGEYPLTEIRR